MIITESTIRRDLQLEDAEGVDCLPNAVIFEQLTLMGLKRRVKKLERRMRSRTHGLKRLYKIGLSARVKSSEDEGLGEEDASKQGRIANIDANENITLVSTHDEQMFDADQCADQDLGGEELKHTKPKAKAKGIVFHEPKESTTTTTVEIPKPRSHDKGKDKMIEEHMKLKKKDKIKLDEEVALKEDLEVLWRLAKDRFEKVKPVDHIDSFLLHNLKTMFKHHVEYNNILYYLLVEKMYPLTNHTLHQMFNDVKLQVDYECEMAFELLRLVKKHLKEGYVSQ
uniref:Uncharacterized protein n=1 Tax=Tanacetum cinerariifolium TaxID=118510 RepID=A0A6L2LIM9_TANCI|nr:hypothetical protein [Tanacetum cinerariifolium]